MRNQILALLSMRVAGVNRKKQVTKIGSSAMRINPTLRPSLLLLLSLNQAIIGSIMASNKRALIMIMLIAFTTPSTPILGIRLTKPDSAGGW